MAKTTDLFTVVFPDHHGRLTDGLWNLLRSHHAVDFDLSWVGRSIRAHRLILNVFLSPDKLARCGQQMNHGDSHPDPPTVEAGLEAYLPGTNYLDCLLEFLYRGRITVGDDTLERLLELASELDLRVLVDAIETARNGQKNGTTDTVQKTPKRRRRKGIPVKLANKDDDNQSDEDPDDPPFEANPRPVVKVTIGAKRSRGRPRGACKAAGVKRTAVTKRRKKDETSDSIEVDSGSETSGEEKEQDGEDAGSTKQKRKSVVGKSEKVAKKKGEQALAKLAYKRLWYQRQPMLRCLHCSYETQCKRSYRVHMSRHDKTAPIYRCELCSKAFLNGDALERHQLSQHATAPVTLSCQLCDYNTTKKRNLRSHMMAAHHLNAKGEPVAKTYNCSQCNFSSAFASHLTNHEMTHKTDKPFQCDQCSYACIRKYELDKHYKVVHLNERLFLCVECGHKSASQGALKSHMRTHTGEKPYVCQECGKAYTSSGKLKLHVKRHQSDEKSGSVGIATGSGSCLFDPGVLMKM